MIIDGYAISQRRRSPRQPHSSLARRRDIARRSAK
jgi:hypothetical protein